jgi:hypothetical protein
MAISAVGVCADAGESHARDKEKIAALYATIRRHGEADK